MKILFLCHKMPFPSNDGGTIATLNMIKGFAQLGDEVSVLAMQTHKHSFPIEKLPNKLKINIHWNQVWVNTKLSIYKALSNLIFSNKPYNGVRFESINYSDKLREILLNEKFDIIQLEGLYLGSYIEIIRELSHAKIAFRAHNIEHEIWQRLAEHETFAPKRWYLNSLAKRVKRFEFEVLNKIDLLIPITQKDADTIEFSKTENMMVSPSGMDENIFKINPIRYPKSLFYIGALDWIPNTEALIWFLKNVWKTLSIDFPEWEFVIAGRNASQKFKDELKNYPVTFLGEVERATDFIDAYNIMIVPLLAGSGMRIKIIEGMARGKCILTTNIGAEGIPANPDVEIFIRNSHTEFAIVLKNLMQNPEQIEKCGENAFIFVQQNYNNHVLINKLKHFYSKHLGNS